MTTFFSQPDWISLDHLAITAIALYVARDGVFLLFMKLRMFLLCVFFAAFQMLTNMTWKIRIAS